MSRQYWQEIIAWVTSDGTAIANTTTETAIYTAVSIPANYMQDGRVLELICRGKFSTTTGPPTLRFRARWGAAVSGTLIADSGTMTTIASVTNAMFEVILHLQVRSNGATGTILGMGTATLLGAVAPTVGSATGAPAIAAMGSAGVTAPATATCDFTTTTNLTLSAEWSAASASNTLTGMQYLLKALN